MYIASNNFKFFWALIIIFLPIMGFAQDEEPRALYEEICGIRLMFCGGTIFALLFVVIASIGILLFVGKITWRTVSVLVTGMIIFVSAEQVVETIFTPPPGSDVVSLCSCD